MISQTTTTLTRFIKTIKKLSFIKLNELRLVFFLMRLNALMVQENSLLISRLV